MNMFIGTECTNEYLIIRVRGRLGGESSIDFYRQVREIADGNEELPVIIDFSQVDFIDSSGLGSLVAINSHLVKLGRRLILTGVLENLLGLLKITNLHSVLQIEDTVEDVIGK